MAVDRRTIKAWAHRLSAEDEQLTMDETLLLATIAQADRLLEIRDALQDVQARTQRMELWLAAHIPGYDQQTRALVREFDQEDDDDG